MTKPKLTFAALVVGLALAGCDAANEAGQPVKQEAATAAAPAALTPATLTAAQRAYTDAGARMHAGMGAAIDADADVAFMAGMIPHHQGAVDMARVVLEHGKDPETLKLAEAVIKAQTAEIAMMQAWLKKRGAKPSASLDTPVSNADGAHGEMGH